MSIIKHSVTLFGFGLDYIRGTLTFEDIMAKTTSHLKTKEKRIKTISNGNIL